MKSTLFALLAVGATVAAIACYQSSGAPAVGAGPADIGTATTQNFDQGILHSPQPVLVDFFATWCGPCKKMAPIVEDFAHKHKAQFKVFECDIDQNHPLAEKFGIDAVPTFLVFKNGKIVGRFTGYDEAPVFESNIMGSIK